MPHKGTLKSYENTNFIYMYFTTERINKIEFKAKSLVQLNLFPPEASPEGSILPAGSRSP